MRAPPVVPIFFGFKAQFWEWLFCIATYPRRRGVIVEMAPKTGSCFGCHLHNVPSSSGVCISAHTRCPQFGPSPREYVHFSYKFKILILPSRETFSHKTKRGLYENRTIRHSQPHPWGLLSIKGPGDEVAIFQQCVLLLTFFLRSTQILPSLCQNALQS